MTWTKLDALIHRGSAYALLAGPLLIPAGIAIASRDNVAAGCRKVVGVVAPMRPQLRKRSESNFLPPDYRPLH